MPKAVFTPVLLILALLIGCRADRHDDAFARDVIQNLRTRSAALAAQLEPHSEIAAVGWEALCAAPAIFPPGQSDSVILVEWERLKDEHGPARKLTYRVRSQTRRATYEIWIVDKGGKTYLNTLQTTLDENS
jgi:hypothetical protein